MKLNKDLILGRKYLNKNTDLIYLVKEFTKDGVIFIVSPNEPNEFTSHWNLNDIAGSFEPLLEARYMLKERLSRDNE